MTSSPAGSVAGEATPRTPPGLMVLPALRDRMRSAPPLPDIEIILDLLPSFLHPLLLWCAWLLYRLAWRLALCSPPAYQRTIPLYTSAGVPSSLPPACIDFHTADGVRCQLLHWRRRAGVKPSSARTVPSGDLVVLMSGLTTSSDMFIMPEHVGLVEGLLQSGVHDVFTVDNRISRRFPYNLEGHDYTMDHLAAYDNPSMLRALNAWSEAEYGTRRGMHIIAHCVNSMSISMTAAAGLITPDMQVRSIACNSVSLTPHVGPVARVKMGVGPTVSNLLFNHISPSFIREPTLTLRRLFGHAVSLFHWECESPECHMVSFMWSFGFPGVWNHATMLETSHARAADLYGATSVRYHSHIVQCLRAGRITRCQHDDASPLSRMPADYLQSALDGKLCTPLLLFTGAHNGVFYDSQQELKMTLDAAREEDRSAIRTPVELHVFEGYGHQDVLMGANVAVDVLPVLLDFIERFQTPGLVKVRAGSAAA